MCRIRLLAIVLFFVQCRHDCQEGCRTFDPCNASCYETTTPGSFDLTEFVLRSDSHSTVGHCTALKEVVGAGAYDWKANNLAQLVGNDRMLLVLTNYADTAFWGLEFWAFSREYISLFANPHLHFQQPLFSPEANTRDSSICYTRYIRWHDDHADAVWVPDSTRQSSVRFTRYDSVNCVVEGEFSLFFRLEEPSRHPVTGPTAEKVNFRCGNFRARVLK